MNLKVGMEVYAKEDIQKSQTTALASKRMKSLRCLSESRLNAAK